MASDTKTIVFGLDGAHFELIRPWIEEGYLPNIERMIDSGTTADLQSVLPPVTSPNWKAYATGKNPGKIGIFWWENIDVANRRVHYPLERKHTNTEFWELLSEQDPVGVLGVPTTYPPKELDSFVIAGAPDGENEGYASPPEVADLVEEEFEYRVNKTHRLDVNREAAVAEIHDIIDMRFSTAKYLFDEYDLQFLQATTFYLNSLHHFFWDSKQTKKGWKIVDRHLGDFLDGEYNVVLMSDHGSTSVDTVFHLNSWLEQNGYLALDDDLSGLLSKVGITKERLLQVTSALGVKELARNLVPRRIRHRIPTNQGEIKQEGKTNLTDWDQTKAVASGQGVVYLVPGEDSESSSLKQQLIEELEGVTGPNGEPIAKTVHDGEDVYSGEYEDEAPDIVLEQRKGVHIPGSMGRDDIFSSPTEDGWRGENKRHGIFVASGPDFSDGSLDSLSILDLAPMFLHLHGLPIPEDMDGEVPKGVYSEESSASERPPEYRVPIEGGSGGTAETDEELRDRLSDLGYLE